MSSAILAAIAGFNGLLLNHQIDVLHDPKTLARLFTHFHVELALNEAGQVQLITRGIAGVQIHALHIHPDPSLVSAEHVREHVP